MSKKVISILLSAAMLVAIFCVGFGAVSASAADDEKKVAYYFLAPDNFLNTNNVAGAYWWQPAEPEKWPGIEMTAAPEVGKNVFRAEVPVATTTVIFNSSVDGAVDAENAHQTKNVNLEGYNKGESDYYGDTEVANFYDMIYVLDLNAEAGENEFSGEATLSGEWFSLEPTADNYYRTTNNYKGYKLADTATPDSAPAKTAPAEEEGKTDDSGKKTDDGKKTNTPDVAPAAKEYKAASKAITVTYNIGNIDSIGAVGSKINYSTEYFKLVDTAKSEEPSIAYNDSILANEANAGTVEIGATFNPKGDTHTFKDAAGMTVFTFTFDAVKDFDAKDLEEGITLFTDTLVQITDGGNAKTPVIKDNVVVAEGQKSEQPTHFVWLNVTNNAKKNDTTPVVVVSSDSDSEVDSSTSSDKTETGDADSSKKDSSGKSGTTSTVSSTTPTVQTAGTFAVITLVVILMAAAGVVIYTRKKTEE